jgi:hypothetical protein
VSSYLCRMWRCINMFIEACPEQGDFSLCLHFLLFKSKLNIILSSTSRPPVSATHLPLLSHPSGFDHLNYAWQSASGWNKSLLIILSVNSYYQITSKAIQIFGNETGGQLDEFHSATLYRNSFGCKFTGSFWLMIMFCGFCVFYVIPFGEILCVKKSVVGSFIQTLCSFMNTGCLYYSTLSQNSRSVKWQKDYAGRAELDLHGHYRYHCLEHIAKGLVFRIFHTSTICIMLKVSLSSIKSWVWIDHIFCL